MLISLSAVGFDAVVLWNCRAHAWWWHTRALQCQGCARPGRKLDSRGVRTRALADESRQPAPQTTWLREAVDTRESCHGRSEQPWGAIVTAVGFEPTPLRTGAWSQRLRPLGQTVLPKCSALFDIFFKTRRMSKSYKTGSTEKRQLQSKPNLTPYETTHIPGLGAFYEIDKTSRETHLAHWIHLNLFGMVS